MKPYFHGVIMMEHEFLRLKRDAVILISSLVCAILLGMAVWYLAPKAMSSPMPREITITRVGSTENKTIYVNAPIEIIKFNPKIIDCWLIFWKPKNETICVPCNMIQVKEGTVILPGNLTLPLNEVYIIKNSGVKMKTNTIVIAVGGARIIGSIVTWYGLGAKTWYTLWVPFPLTLTTTHSVAIAGLFSWGDTGHMENPTEPDTVIAIFTDGFYYRAETSPAGCMGVSYTATGEV